MEVQSVQGTRDATLLEHERGAQEQGRRVADVEGSGLCAGGHGGRRDPRRGFDASEFRDEARTVVVIASGPSAVGTLRSCEHWRGFPAICVNDSWRLHPGAAGLYAADRDWWEQRDSCGLRYIDLVRKFFRGRCCTPDAGAAREHDLELVALERREGLSTKEAVVAAGGLVGNSGAQAINLAYLWGARRLVLVGFDMCKLKDETDQVLSHWHGDHPKPLKNDSPYPRFVAGMAQMAADLYAHRVEVINCSPRSALPYWPRRPLFDALPAVKAG